ncbi:hypothetical protein GMOD_00004517 [Pyrenophora seminiperda CCB06]|uniref:Uncharacterized protein n=1 Tax=Pyrenophora seminiperda CCB06 TaxID=1302712 RepID=A0A3M7M1B2_9PLEO|nr:hypothetical protein GMOD_00004517 [Pyrenophora seminiperda CCB06]
MGGPGLEDIIMHERECSKLIGDLLDGNGTHWPMIIKEDSIIHWTITDIHKLALQLLQECSRLAERRNDLKLFLELPRGFSASGLVVSSDDIMEWTEIRLSEAVVEAEALDDPHDPYIGTQAAKKSHYNMLNALAWIRKDSLRRMFKPGFKGKYKEHDENVKNGGTSLNTLDDLNFAGNSCLPLVMGSADSSIDSEHETLGQDTPPITRTASPALTERQINYKRTTAEGDQRKNEPPKQPTLQYVCIIETEEDQAIYKISPGKVDKGVRKKLAVAKDMCDEMVRMGYGGKVKLQDVMDMGIRMANKPANDQVPANDHVPT